MDDFFVITVSKDTVKIEDKYGEKSGVYKAADVAGKRIIDFVKDFVQDVNGIAGKLELPESDTPAFYI